MGLYKDNEVRDDYSVNEVDQSEDAEVRHHRKRVRQLLEERLERKRLKEELDDFDNLDEDEFDWDSPTYRD